MNKHILLLIPLLFLVGFAMAKYGLIDIEYPNGGETESGTIEICARINNLDWWDYYPGRHVKFFYNKGETTDVFIDQDAVHDDEYYCVDWNTEEVEDGPDYKAKAELWINDTGPRTDYDYSDDFFTVQNSRGGAPEEEPPGEEPEEGPSGPPELPGIFN